MGSKEQGVPTEYLAQGYAVASINYRLSQHAKFPAQIEDCKAAVRWLRAHANDYRLDPNHFAAWGGSAEPAISWGMLANKPWKDATVTPNDNYALARDWKPDRVNYEQMLAAAEQDPVYCLDAATGRGIWKHTYACAAKDPSWYHGTRCTPSVDGDRVYTVSRQGHLFCLAADSGVVKWTRDFTNDFGAKVPFYGYSLSPLVEGDLVIVEPAAPGASMVAFDKLSGKVVWQAGDDPASFSSPMAFDLKGERCVVVFTAVGPVGRRVKDGLELWRHPWKTDPAINAATPIVPAPGCSSRRVTTGCALIDVSVTPPTTQWRNKNVGSRPARVCPGLDPSRPGSVCWAG